MPNAGTSRTEVEYVWPALLRPSWDVRLVYLDLNHWIGLAKAAVGHRTAGDYVPALEVARAAAAAGTAIFPLSWAHYMEVAAIHDSRHRRDIATVMEELSGFRTLASRSVVMTLEIEAVLDQHVRRPDPFTPVKLIGYGSGHAFGRVGGVRIYAKGRRDITHDLRLQWKDGPEAFDSMMTKANTLLERGMLRGPMSASQEARLRAIGWDPLIGRKIASERAAAENELVAMLDADPKWRRGRLRDVVSARYFAREILDQVNKSIGARGLQPEAVAHDPPSMRVFVDAMPSADVCVTLMTAAHRNSQRSWRSNGMFDIDALSVAVAYCDIVVTERHANRLLATAHMRGIYVPASRRTSRSSRRYWLPDRPQLGR